MIKIILPILISIVSAATCAANPNWKIHTTFDGAVDNVFETPAFTYFTSRAMSDMNGQRKMSLFRYDKEGDELQNLSPDNHLATPIVSAVQYNPQKGYVVAVNSNYDITFLYDDGRVVNMADYRLASIDQSKDINSITVDPWHNMIYMATKFGYIAVNDEKYEIAESRIYGQELKQAARVGDMFVVVKDADLYSAKMSEPRFSLEEYTQKLDGAPFGIASLSENKAIAFNYGGTRHRMYTLDATDSDLKITQVGTDAYGTASNNKNGVLVPGTGTLIQIDKDGTQTTVARPQGSDAHTLSSYDLTEVWEGMERRGLKSSRKGSADGDWSVTREFMIPNAPSPFVTPEIAAHPTLGTFVTNYGFDYNFQKFPRNTPVLLSGYKDGWWTNYSPAYTYPERGKVMITCNGMAFDTENPNFVYLSSVSHGFIRLNLSDPSDIIHFSKPSDADNGNPGFMALVEEPVTTNRWACNFTAPRMDADGNLWLGYADYENQTPPGTHLFCWLPADRKASTPSNIIPPKRILVKGASPSNAQMLLPLKHSSNKNMLVYSERNTQGATVLVNTAGTPVDDTDDSVVIISSYADQDGESLSIHNPRYYWEDPANGNVWVCHGTGVFYISPKDFMEGKQGVAYRPKIARNDGTNLADRLLENVIVNSMTRDGAGRKWFATGGGGVVCTSSDGRTIEEELNKSNSPLPSDDVFGLCYVPETNSLIISTSEGIAEYFMTSSAVESGDGNLKIYPNPVRPDYYGFVTIEGLPERTIVKITDAAGHIVKELGPATGDVQWDVTNHQFQRVESGVYFVLASSGQDASAFSTVGKILVVN